MNLATDSFSINLLNTVSYMGFCYNHDVLFLRKINMFSPITTKILRICFVFQYGYENTKTSFALGVLHPSVYFLRLPTIHC
jgi:hypothetical protein